MPTRTSLGELELLILLALARVGDDAYGAGIRKEIADRTGRSVTPGAIYPTLDRLERKGLVRSRASDPEPVPGGRSKRLFTLRPAGLAEVRRTWQQYAMLAQGIAALKPERQR